MKQENKFAQVMRWLASGESVLAKCGESSGWMKFPEDFNERATHKFLLGQSMYAEYEFRIAPKKVKIGDQEIEAPISEFTGEAWYCDPDGSPHKIDRTIVSGWIAMAIEAKRLFATPEAAEAAHKAISALLSGKESS